MPRAGLLAQPAAKDREAAGVAQRAQQSRQRRRVQIRRRLESLPDRALVRAEQRRVCDAWASLTLGSGRVSRDAPGRGR